jgi:hypothetical protein
MRTVISLFNQTQFLLPALNKTELHNVTYTKLKYNSGRFWVLQEQIYTILLGHEENKVWHKLRAVHPQVLNVYFSTRFHIPEDGLLQ